jgi:hypothetical protein
MRFDENGIQTEVATLTAKPAGSEWKIVPADFDHAKRYCLNVAGKIEEISSEELMATRFANFQSMALKEISMLIDKARNKCESVSKRKSHDLQEKAANAVLVDALSDLTTMIAPLAAIRHIDILEMAQLILAKSEIANQKIMELEAMEDNYEKLIKSAETPEQIDF